MVFPNTPLDIRTDLQLDGVWTDSSGDVYVRDPKEIDCGRRDMGARTDPGHLSLTFNNRDGKYSPRNAMSPLYGLIGRNTPVRVSVPGPTRYLELSGATDSYASTPDTAALDITGDLDVRWEGEASWYGPGAQMLIGKWGATGNRSYNLRLQNGTLILHVTRDGAVGPTSYAPLPALPKRAALRGILDADNGAGGWTIRLYWAPSLAGPWTQMGTEGTGTTPVTIHASTAPLLIAPNDLAATPPRRVVDGRVYAAEVRNGIDGTVVASPDFEAQPLGTTPFADSAGLTWSYSGTAHISGRDYRFTGEISAWPKKWQPDGSDVWTPVEAYGLLHRYDQGAKALNSTLRRRIPSGLPDAYWPFEEDRDASHAYSPITGVQPAAVTGLEWAAVDTLPSSKALPRLTAAATLSAIVPAGTDGQWQIEFVYNADDKAPPGTGPHAEVISVSTTGTVRRWVIGMRAGNVRIYGFDASGTDIIFRAIAVGGDVFHGWVRMQIWASDNGDGTLDYRVNFQDVGGDAGGLGGTTAGTAGRVTAVTANWGALTEGWGFGHLSVLPTAGSSLYTGSDNAYAGETAWERLFRLASEESLPLARIAGELTPQQVGPQRPENLLDLLHAAADADGGILLEDRDRLGLIYRDRSSMYTQEPALTLVYGEPGLGPDLEPVDDDTATRTDRTVKRDGGSEARAILEEGRLSVQDAPNGIGVYDDSQTLSLNSDTQAEPIAHWLLHLGTYDGDRYPVVSVMLHKAPNLIPQVLAMREGDLIRITNLPAYVHHGDLDLIVQGYHEVLDLQKWDISFNCSPGGPWNTAKADHPVYAKAGTDGTLLVSAVDATATALDVTNVGADWTTDPAEMPIPLEVGGETMTATTITQHGDTFTRTVSGGWGTSATGIAWSTSGGSAGDYSVDGAAGKHVLNSVNVSRRATATAGSADFDMAVDITPSALATGGFYSGSLLARSTDSNNMYMARLAFETAGTVTLSLRKRVGGTETQLATFSTGITYTADTKLRLRFQGTGSAFLARTWLASTSEPDVWQATATDSSLTAAGQFGMRSITASGNTNTAPTISFDNLTIVGRQRFTVTRSVNGVIKSHATGAPVSLAYPAVASL